ncbi:MAG TPA: hypothetical protein VNP97_12680 [Microbacterium sp.]|nr:hypothetical protein [Microbacterium sp.]
MIVLTPEAMEILGLVQVAFTSFATLLAIGLAFLSMPGRATLYWSCAFALGMVATFGVVASGLNDAEMIRRICLGALLGAPALLWSGFRAQWGVRPYVWAGPVVSVLAATAFVVVGDSGWFSTAYRLAFLVAAGFAVLFFFDWLRVGDRRDLLVLPFAIVSVAFGITAVVTTVAGLLYPPAAGNDLGLIRVTPSVGMLFYIGTAVLAVVHLSTRDRAWRRNAAATEAWTGFQDMAAERLAQGQRFGETLSMVHVRLDDLTELRQIAGPASVAQASYALENVARSVFSEQGIVCSPQIGRVYVLVPRTDAVARDLLRVCLEKVSEIEIPGQLPVQPSASAGWASTSTIGYDLPALIYLSREAAAYADHNGGDRWERVSAEVVERMLQPQSLR